MMNASTTKNRIQLLNAWLRTSLKIHSRNRTSRGEIRASRARDRARAHYHGRAAAGRHPKRVTTGFRATGTIARIS